MDRLAGKVAIVTGGARGLGAAIAARLCGEGASVMLADILPQVDATADELRARGHRTAFSITDVCREVDWDALVDTTEATFGGVDILVNNAGIALTGTIEATSEDTLRRVFDVNLIGPFLGMKAVIPAMRERGGGAIVNICSNATRKIVPVSCPYAASKAALANMTKTTAVHCAQAGYNIRVNSIHPGPHETEMILGGGKRIADIPQVARLIDAIPLQRLGKPEDVAAAVAFLASTDASYVTAAELFVDGGVTVI